MSVDDEGTVLHLKLLAAPLPLLGPFLEMRYIALRLVHGIEDNRKVPAVKSTFIHLNYYTYR